MIWFTSSIAFCTPPLDAARDSDSAGDGDFLSGGGPVSSGFAAVSGDGAGTLVVVPDEASAVYVAGGGALDVHDALARSAARVWPVGVMGLGLGLAFRVRILLPAREPSFHSSCLQSLQMQRES